VALGAVDVASTALLISFATRGCCGSPGALPRESVFRQRLDAQHSDAVVTMPCVMELDEHE
jgi:hypothetical protein